MNYLLVENPQGFQSLIEVGIGGGYFDASRVLWDTRTDGPLPEITLGGMVRDGDTLAFDQLRLNASTAAMTPPVPTEVTMRQACLALEGAGLLDDVEAIVATLPKVYQIEWLRASVVLRSNALVEMVRQQNSMTEAQIDDLFVTAATL